MTTVRTVLGCMPAPLRIQLRRLLGSCSGIEVVGQLLDPAQQAELLASTGCHWLVLDGDSPLSGAGTRLEQRKHPDGRPLPGCLIVHRAGHRVTTADFHPEIVYLERPALLDQEVGDGPFCRQMAGILRGGLQPASRAPVGLSDPLPKVPIPRHARHAGRNECPDILAIGASTGGPEALQVLLASLGNRLHLPIVITQHLGHAFTRSLAATLERVSRIPCHEAEDGMYLLPGHAYLAPGGRHLCIRQTQALLTCALDDGPAECFCKPSVDVMLRSLSGLPAVRTLVVILTGMGQDGLVGTGLIKAGGGWVLAQDEKSSVVWGMPGAVAKANLCEAILPLDELGSAVLRMAGEYR